MAEKENDTFYYDWPLSTVSNILMDEYYEKNHYNVSVNLNLDDDGGPMKMELNIHNIHTGKNYVCVDISDDEKREGLIKLLQDVPRAKKRLLKAYKKF